MANGMDFEPPMASIKKLIRAVVPDNIRFTKEANEAFQRAASVFIFYLTHCANDICREGKRMTIKSEDVVMSLYELGFAEFAGPVEEFLAQLEQDTADKKAAAAKRKSGEGEESGAADGGATDLAKGGLEGGVGEAQRQEETEAGSSSSAMQLGEEDNEEDDEEEAEEEGDDVEEEDDEDEEDDEEEKNENEDEDSVDIHDKESELARTADEGSGRLAFDQEGEKGTQKRHGVVSGEDEPSPKTRKLAAGGSPSSGTSDA